MEQILSKYSQIGENQSIGERIFTTLRNLILNEDIERGEKLFESKLAEYLEVSRTPVREALQRLEQEGLIEAQPRRYYVVKGISAKDAVEIIYIRAALESMVVEKVCDEANEELLVKLEENLNESEKHLQNSDIENLNHANGDFHKILLDFANMPRVATLLTNYYDYIIRFRKISLSIEERRYKVIESHRKIFNALKSNDKEEAVKAMKEHILSIVPYIEPYLEESS